MLEADFEQLYLLFRANYYKRMVEKADTQKERLSSTEHHCVEIIYLLNQPTISEFAKFLNISVPNATYKINNLVEKGYLVRVPSQKDKREFHLTVTDKFLRFYGLNNQDNAHLMRRIRENCTPDEITAMEASIQKMIAFMQENTQEEPND